MELIQTGPISDLTQAIEARDGHEISRQDAIIDRFVGAQWASRCPLQRFAVAVAEALTPEKLRRP